MSKPARVVVGLVLSAGVWLWSSHPQAIGQPAAPSAAKARALEAALKERARAAEEAREAARKAEEARQAALKQNARALKQAREAAQKVQSARKMKYLILALHNYHDAHKSFPPAYSTDKDGKPLLSWRVHVLPYLEQGPLYRRFHLDEPWDSEHNKQLISKMPSVFRSPNSKAEPGKTNYLGAGGTKGIFRGKDAIGLRDITDGSSNTIITVEVNDSSAVIWTKPDDFTPDPKDLKKGLLGLWSSGFHVGLADGSVRFLDEGIDDKALAALFTRNGAEAFDRQRLRVTARRPAVSTPVARPAAPAAVAQPAPSREETTAQVKKLGGKLLTKGFKSSWSPDAARIAFGRGVPGTRQDAEGGIAVLDLESGRTTQLVQTGKDPAWSPGDGRFIAYVTGYGPAEEIWLVKSSGGEPRKLADGGFPAWSADGKTVLYHSRKERKLMAVDVDAEKPEPKAVIDLSAWYPAISLDGKQVAYRSESSRSGSHLIVASLETGNVTKILPTPVTGRGFLGGWSPDAKQVGFGGFGAAGLWIVNLENGQSVRVAQGPLTMPAWSADGSKLAFDLRWGEGPEVWMIETKELETLKPEEVPVDRYAVPEGGVEVLLKFLEDLRRFRAESQEEYNEHRAKAPAALKAAATRILKLEKDRWSKAYQTALRVLLGERVRTIREANAHQQRQTLEMVKTFLTARLEKGIEPQDVSLALSAARALEYADGRELAAEAYESLAKPIAKSDDEKLSNLAKMMEGAARRLRLLGHEMKMEGTTMDGTEFDWASYRGKVVLVDFWATWCGPCRAELPNVRKNYKRYHDRGFDVVGISTDRDREALEKFLQKEQLPWVTLHAKDPEQRHPMAEYYGVMAIPTVLLVDREGKVVSLRARGAELDRLLEELIGPPVEEKSASPTD